MSNVHEDINVATAEGLEEELALMGQAYKKPKQEVNVFEKENAAVKKFLTWFFNF